MNCPKCGGLMWDNRESKKSPKQPDYKCKNRQCDNAIWLDKKDVAASNGAGPIQTTQRPLGPLYNDCMEFAKKACHFHFGASVLPADIIAATATVFIQAVNSGAPIRAQKPVAPPPPPPPQPVYEPDEPLPF